MNKSPQPTKKYQRIVSTVPSITELLFDLGLDEEVVGITKFCIHPNHWFRSKTRIGGTKNLNIEKIIALQPDLILANKEENTKEQIEQLQKLFPVYISDITSVEDAMNMIRTIGDLVDKKENATSIIETILQGKHKHQLTSSNLKALYLIWKEPFMAAGIDTFIHAMMSEAGIENCITSTRYPVLSVDEIQTLKPDVILLSSEPYPFKEKHRLEITQLFPFAKIILVDGELFSWYGSRMSKSFEYFRALKNELV